MKSILNSKGLICFFVTLVTFLDFGQSLSAQESSLDKNTLEKAQPWQGQKWSFPWGLEAISAPQLWAKGIYGQGVRILVVDSGIDKKHPALKRAFVEGLDLSDFNLELKDHLPQFIPDFFNAIGWPLTLHNENSSQIAQIPTWPEQIQGSDYSYFDEIGHGTHVSGTLAGFLTGEDAAKMLSEQGILERRFIEPTGTDHRRIHYPLGVAPGAKLYTAKICKQISCNLSALVAAIEWGIKLEVDIINLSIGGAIFSTAVAAATDRAAKAGILLVAASGNSGSTRLAYPAAYHGTMAVGAMRQDQTLSPSSQRSPQLELMAPGEKIFSALPARYLPAEKIHQNFAYTADYDYQQAYAAYPGTSMATPHVSGVAALLKSAFPTLTGMELRDLLLQGAIITGEERLYNGDIIIYRRVDALKSYQLAKKLFESQTHTSR